MKFHMQPPNMPPPKLKILLLGDDSLPTGAVVDYMQAFFCHSRHDFTLLNPVRVRKFPFDLAQYDAVLLHYSVFIISEWHLSPTMAAALRAYRGLKVQIIQDEYRTVNLMAERMAWLGINVLFTHLPPTEIAKGYPQACIANVTKHSLPVTGFPPSHLLHYPITPLTERPRDIIYRGRALPYHLGSLGQEKILIAAGVKARAAAYDLTIDIACEESDRIYGDAWLRFIASSRAALGTESGASIWDFTGAIERDTKAYLHAHPHATFDEVLAARLHEDDGKINYTSVSPRLFEAVCLRTALVLFPGHYNGIFEAGKHYIELKKDCSNFADVAAQIKDLRHLEAMTERALQDIILSNRYSEAHFIGVIDAAIDAAYQQLRAQHPTVIAATLCPTPTVSCVMPAAGLRHQARRIAAAAKQFIVYHGRQLWFYGERATAFSRRTFADPNLTLKQKIRRIGGRVIFGLRLAKEDIRRTTTNMFGLEFRLTRAIIAKRCAKRWRNLTQRGQPDHQSVATEVTMQWCLRSRLPRTIPCDRCHHANNASPTGTASNRPV